MAEKHDVYPVKLAQQEVDYNDADNLVQELGDLLSMVDENKVDPIVRRVRQNCLSMGAYLKKIAQHPYEHRDDIMYIHNLVSRYEDARVQQKLKMATQSGTKTTIKEPESTTDKDKAWGTAIDLEVTDYKKINEDLICLNQSQIKIRKDKLTQEELQSFALSRTLKLLSIKNANQGEDYVILAIKFSHIGHTGRFMLNSRFDIHHKRKNAEGFEEDNFDALRSGVETLMFDDDDPDGGVDPITYKIDKNKTSHPNEPFVVNKIIPSKYSWNCNDDTGICDARNRLQLLASNNFVDGDLKKAISAFSTSQINTGETFKKIQKSKKEVEMVDAKSWISHHTWFLVTFKGDSSVYKSLTNNKLLERKIFENLTYRVHHGLSIGEGDEPSHITVSISVYLQMALMYHDDMITRSTISAEKKLIMSLWRTDKVAFGDPSEKAEDFDTDLIVDVYYVPDSVMKAQSLYVGCVC